MHIGFVGLGRMGQAMASRLIGAGFSLTVWNRTLSKAEPLLEWGAHLAESLPALANVSDLTFTMLTDDNAVIQVYDPSDGLLAGDVTGHCAV